MPRNHGVKMSVKYIAEPCLPPKTPALGPALIWKKAPECRSNELWMIFLSEYALKL